MSAICELVMMIFWVFIFFFQAEDGIRDAQESRGLGNVYKRQHQDPRLLPRHGAPQHPVSRTDLGLVPHSVRHCRMDARRIDAPPPGAGAGRHLSLIPT